MARSLTATSPPLDLPVSAGGRAPPYSALSTWRAASAVIRSTRPLPVQPPAGASPGVRNALSAKYRLAAARDPDSPSAILSSSECPNGAYYAAAEGSLPAAVGVQPESGQFPLAILRVIRENTPRGVARRSARQVQDEVVVL